MKIISNHYNDTVTVCFWPENHRYKLEGEKNYLVSVTAAVGVLDRSRPLLKWAEKLSSAYLLDRLRAGEDITETMILDACSQHEKQKEKAATIGSSVHEWIEQYIKKENPPIPKDKKVKNGVLAFLKWVLDNDVKFLESEKVVYSQRHNYVGIMDAIITIGKGENHQTKHVIDFKTSSGFYYEMYLQLAAYQAAYSEEHGTVFGDRIVVKLDKDLGLFELRPLLADEYAEHFAAFLSCLHVKKSNKIWEGKYGYYALKK